MRPIQGDIHRRASLPDRIIRGVYLVGGMESKYG